MSSSAVGDEIRVRDIMTSNVSTVHASHSMPLVASIMELERVRHVPVIDDDRRVVGLVNLPVISGEHTVGIVADRDLRVAEAVYRARDTASAQLAVALVGTEKVYEVPPDALLEEVLAEMSRLRIGAAMVVDGGRLIGTLTTMDACRLFSEYLKTLSARALRRSEKHPVGAP